MRAKRAAACIAIIAFLSAGNVYADVEVRGDSGCVDFEALQTQVERALFQYKPKGAEEILVRVRVASADKAGAQVALDIVLPDGSLALQRNYELAVQDCSSANELLITVVSDFLEELPAKRWSAPPIPVVPEETKVESSPAPTPIPADIPAPAPPARSRTIAFALATAGLFAVDTVDGETLTLLQTELGAEASLLAKRQAWSVGMWLRGSTKHELGAGDFRPTSLLADVGLTRGERIVWGLRLRGGAVRIGGSGFDSNFTRWLPSGEVGIHLGYRWKGWQAKAILLATPIRHDISVENRNDVLSLPRFRAGLGLVYVVGNKKL